MSSGDTLCHPIRHHTRTDGRQVIPARQLDFRGEHDAFRINHDERHLLVPGTLFGAMVRYHWPTAVKDWQGTVYRDRSRRFLLIGEYQGQDEEIDIPVNKWRPQGIRHKTNVPMLEMMIWLDTCRKVAIGQMAIARLREGERAMVDKVDHAAIQRTLGIAASGTHIVPHIGIVFSGGLYYVPPQAQQQPT